MTCKLIDIGKTKPASPEGLIEVMASCLGFAREVELANVVVVGTSRDATQVLARSCHTMNKDALLSTIKALEELKLIYADLYKEA